MRRPGSYKLYKTLFIEFKEKINKIHELGITTDEFQSKNILDLTKKILDSDIFFDEEVLKNNEIPLFENILMDILNLLNYLKGVDNWNEIYFWLVHNLFLYFWSNTISFFSKEVKNQINSIMDDKWRQFQDKISKWNTDFPLEFVLGISFLVWKEKEEILTYFKNLEENFKNTIFTDLIKNLIKFISLDLFPIEILHSRDRRLDTRLCIVILIMKFGRLNDYQIAFKILDPILLDKWEQIFTKDNEMAKDSIVRDWIGAKYIQISLAKKIESENLIKTRELPYFSISPREFERLIYWILKSDINWTNVQWRGAAGKEKGKDIFAVKIESNRNWIVQAKRDKNFSRKDLNNEYLKVKPEIEKYNAEGYLICIAKNASDDLRKAGEELQKKNSHIFEIWDSEDLNFILKSSPLLLFEFFNI